MAQFGPTGGVAAPSAALAPIIVENPTVINVTLGTAGTEGTVVIPSDTKMYRVQARGGAKLQFGYNLGDSATSFFTINSGAVYQTPNNVALNLSGALTIYIQAPNKDSVVVEVEAWS